MIIRYQGFAKGKHIQAIKAFTSGNYKEASSIWIEIQEHTTNDIVAMKGLACCYFLEDKIRETRSILEEALEIASTDPEITNLLALSYLKEGSAHTAIEKILDTQDLRPDPLLQNTLEKIKNLKNPDMGKIISLVPYIQITLPRTTIFSPAILAKLKIYSPIFIILSIILLIIIFYPNLRNTIMSLNIRNRGDISIATEVNIKDIENIVNARENFRIILNEDVIIRKFNELKQAISDKHPNKARMLVNELLGSNASLAIKERVEILESFIVDSTSDNIDYVPRYAEIAVAPAIYQDVLIRWSGTLANIYHQGRKLTTFDLLVNFLGGGQVEGIATVEMNGLQEYNNGDKITVIGKVIGISKNNRIIIEGIKIIKN